MATDSAVTALSVATAVTLMCTSLSQHCHFHCCHNALLVFTATALCSFSLSQHCAHRFLTTVGFLLWTSPSDITDSFFIIPFPGIHLHCSYSINDFTYQSQSPVCNLSCPLSEVWRMRSHDKIKRKYRKEKCNTNQYLPADQEPHYSNISCDIERCERDHDTVIKDLPEPLCIIWDKIYDVSSTNSCKAASTEC